MQTPFRPYRYVLFILASLKNYVTNKSDNIIINKIILKKTTVKMLPVNLVLLQFEVTFSLTVS